MSQSANDANPMIMTLELLSLLDMKFEIQNACTYFIFTMYCIHVMIYNL